MSPSIISRARYRVEGYVSGYDRSGGGTGVHNLRLLGFSEFKVFLCEGEPCQNDMEWRASFQLVYPHRKGLVEGSARWQPPDCKFVENSLGLKRGSR